MRPATTTVDWLTHHVHTFEANSDRYRPRESKRRRAKTKPDSEPHQTGLSMQAGWALDYDAVAAELTARSEVGIS